MSTFTNAQVEYLTSQQLGRLATVGKDNRPHVVPVGVFYDPETETVVIGCVATMTATKKWRDAVHNPDVAIAVDDVVSVDPWMARGMEIRGHAETHTTGGAAVGERIGATFPFDEAWIRVRPRRVLAWGIEDGIDDSRPQRTGKASTMV